ncbi:MAG: hypothetical protein FWD82_00990 [Defluviitaleaceae bacterium]|nr:hypothetical protein [Defluviitaleaceae bacterium]
MGIIKKEYEIIENCSFLEFNQRRRICKKMDGIDALNYEKHLNLGWRRKKNVLYHYKCEECAKCNLYKVNTFLFKPKRKHRRLLNKTNGHFLKTNSLNFTNEKYELYNKYMLAKHKKVVSENDYIEYLTKYFVNGFELQLYIYDKLQAVAFIESLRNSVNLVYYMYKIDGLYSDLGNYMYLYMFSFAKQNNLQWAHLGHISAEVPRLAYKGMYNPSYIYTNGLWV